MFVLVVTGIPVVAVVATLPFATFLVAFCFVVCYNPNRVKGDSHMTNQDNVQLDQVAVTKEDVARMLKQIAYRSAYNKSAKAVARRKARQDQLQVGGEWVRSQPA